MKEKKKIFDKQIKKLSGHADDYFGYVVDNRKFDVYLSNYSWEIFYDEMKKSYSTTFKAYEDGDGGELNEKNTKYGIMPPKMASIASSSRFTYLTFKDNYYEKMKMIVDDIEDGGYFKFEDKLYIPKVRSKPNLDASYITSNKAVYIEAKCHELFNYHYLKWKASYFKEGALIGNDKISLGIEEGCIKAECEEYELKKSTFGFKESESLYLDVKQFVCHLLGIANTKHKQKELIYLYFKPKLLNSFEDEYLSLENQFKTFCESKYIVAFCKKHNISLKLVYAENDSMESEFKPNVIAKYYK